MNRKIDKPVLEKPIVGGSKDVWGDILNVNIDNTEKFHTQLLSDLETKDAELARLERDKANKSDLPDLVHPIVDNYVESSVKPTINEYIDSTSKPAINSHVESKKQELNSYVNTTNKPELDKYTKAKEGELDTHTGKKKSELDVYEKAKEGQLDSHTNTKKEELNQHTVQKQGQLDEYTVAKKGELDSHTIEKKNELNTHEKAKEKELDSYVTTVNKPELDKYTNIKKEELNAHTKTKESEITQVTGTKKQEITEHSASELDKFNQGAKQEADKQIGRVVAEGDVQVQRVKDESNGVIPRIEKLESGKVSKSGDTMTGTLSTTNVSDPFIANYTSSKLSGGFARGYQIKIDDVTKSEFGVYGDNGIGEYTYLGSSYSNPALRLHHDDTLYLRANNLKTNNKEVATAINELNSKKSDLTGSTFTGLVAVKKDTNGEAMIALNSTYGNGDIYSGGSAKGVGFKNRTSGKGLFLGDDGSVKLEAKDTVMSGELAIKKRPNTPYLSFTNLEYSLNTPIINMSVGTGNNFTIENTYTNAVFTMNGNAGVEITAKNLNTSNKEVVAAINELNIGKLEKRKGVRNVDFNDLIYDGLVYGYEGFQNAAYDGISVADIKTFSSDWIVQKQYAPIGDGTYKEFVRTKYNGNNWSEWNELWHSGNFNPSTKLDKSSVVNDLTTGGTDSVLSAEQGKVLKQLISSVSGDGGSGGGLIENAKSFNKIVYNGTLTTNGKDIVVGKTLYNPSLYLDGTRIDASEYELNAKVGQITLKQPYAKYEVSWEVEDQLPNHIRFSYPTLDLLINDESIKSIINIGDVIEIQGASDADDGGHRLVKCEDSSKLNGVQIGEGKYLNEIPNTNISRINDLVQKGIDTIGKVDGEFPLESATLGGVYYYKAGNRYYKCVKEYSGQSISNPNSHFDELSVYENRDRLDNLFSMQQPFSFLYGTNSLSAEQEIELEYLRDKEGYVMMTLPYHYTGENGADRIELKKNDILISYLPTIEILKSQFFTPTVMFRKNKGDKIKIKNGVGKMDIDQLVVAGTILK